MDFVFDYIGQWWSRGQLPVGNTMDILWIIDPKNENLSLWNALIGYYSEYKSDIFACEMHYQASILYKSIAARYRPVSYPDGPITARYRFIKNAYWVVGYLVLNNFFYGDRRENDFSAFERDLLVTVLHKSKISECESHLLVTVGNIKMISPCLKCIKLLFTVANTKVKYPRVKCICWLPQRTYK